MRAKLIKQIDELNNEKRVYEKLVGDTLKEQQQINRRLLIINNEIYHLGLCLQVENIKIERSGMAQQ